MIILQVIFWICFIALAHTYIFYPLLLKILAGRKKTKSYSENFKPFISILIPAYNEEKIIRQKLESIFASDYPKEKLEVIVGSDASTDRTNEIVRTFPNVRLVEFNGRSGKPKIINQLATLAMNEILILTDANVMFDKNTIRELAKHFQDEKIGLVDSNMLHLNSQDHGVAKAEGTYIRGEVGIKNNEGKDFGMMMGPVGGCYAVRKSFYSPVPENFLVDDFFINMKVLEKGGQAISELNAKVFEEVPTDWKIEFKRKIRIATGSWQNLFHFLPLLFRFNKLSFCFLSHKVLRWKGPFLMIGIFITSCLISYIILYWDIFFSLLIKNTVEIHLIQLFFLFQVLLLLSVVLNTFLKLLRINFFITRLVTHFFTTNLALLIGFFKFLGGVRSSVWQPTKR